MTKFEKYLQQFEEHERRQEEQRRRIDRRYSRMMARASSPEEVLHANAWHQRETEKLKREQAEGWLRLAKEYEEDRL